MAIATLRAKQTTTTTGTGTLTLLAAATSVRGFQSALGGSSIITPYVLSGASFYEIGVGMFDGGSPGTLTRPSGNVLASSNGGSLVSLPAGTTDVFVPFMPGLRGIRTGTGSDTLASGVAGEMYVWSGTTNQTLSLPATANMPPGVGLPVLNAGTGILTVDAAGGDLMLGRSAILLYPGQSIELFRRGSAWDVLGFKDGLPIRKRGVGATVNGVGTVTFGTAFPNAIDASSIVVTIAGRVAVGSLRPLAIGASSVSAFSVWGDAAESLDFVWQAEGY
jgi:hypothetical protein